MKRMQNTLFFCLIFLLILPATIAGNLLGAQSNAIASINGSLLYEEELYAELSQLEQQAIASGSELQMPLDYSNIETLREHVIETMIQERLLLQECTRRGITIPQKEIESYGRILENEFLSPEQFFDSLQQKGITLEQLHKEIEEALRINQLADLLLYEKQWESSTKEQEAFYHKHLAYFTEPDTFQCKLLVFPSGTSLENAESYRELLATSSPISMAGHLFPLDSDDYQEYTLEFLPIESFPPTMYQEIQELDIGGYAPVHEIKKGTYGIFQLIGKSEKTIQPFHDVQKQIITELTAIEKDKVLAELVVQLEKQGTIQRF